MSPLPISIAALVCGLATIAADWRVRRPAFYLLKPLTTMLLIGIGVLALIDAQGTDALGYRIALVVALGFCLLGDVALMFHGNRWFAAGLGAFLIAHFVFALAFWKDTPADFHMALPGWWPLLLLYGLTLAAVLLPRTGKLAPAVVLYCLALMAMVLTVAARFEGLHTGAAQLTMIGALLFVMSDSVLAVCKFIRPFALGQAAILSTYYLALWCMVWAR